MPRLIRTLTDSREIGRDGKSGKGARVPGCCTNGRGQGSQDGEDNSQARQDSQDSQDTPSRFTFYRPALVTANLVLKHVPVGYLSNFHNLTLSFLTLILRAEDM